MPNGGQHQNLFTSLSTWASGQSENFLTESFAALLTVLRDEAPVTFADAISLLTAEAVRFDPVDVQTVSVRTQVMADHANYPDLELAGPDLRVWVEVKDGSAMNPAQLSRYSALLGQRTEKNRRLVFLSRSLASLPELPHLGPPVTWTSVGRWIDEIRWGEPGQHAGAARYVAGQFREFLKGKGMTIEPVGWELAPGVRSLNALKAMMAGTLQTIVSGTIWRAGGHTVTGWDVPGPNGSVALRLRVYFDMPETVVREVKKDQVIDGAHGFVEHSRDWLRDSLDLASEESHFFARPVTSQRALLHAFVESRLKMTGIRLRGAGEAIAEITEEVDED